MNTSVSDRIFETDQEEAETPIIRYRPREKMEGRFIQRIRPVLRWFGLLSTLAWGVAALSPGTFKIPVPIQGWAFTIGVLWLFGFCAGLFNL